MIYFVKTKKHLGSRVKIGYSKNVHQRLAQLRTSSPIKLDVLLVVPGNREEEATYHEYFSDSRIHGEWFKYSWKMWFFIMVQRNTAFKNIEVADMFNEHEKYILPSLEESKSSNSELLDQINDLRNQLNLVNNDKDSNGTVGRPRSQVLPSHVAYFIYTKEIGSKVKLSESNKKLCLTQAGHYKVQSFVDAVNEALKILRATNGETKDIYPVIKSATKEIR